MTTCEDLSCRVYRVCGSGTCHVSDTLGSEKNFNPNIFFSLLSPSFLTFFSVFQSFHGSPLAVGLIEVPEDELLYS